MKIALLLLTLFYSTAHSATPWEDYLDLPNQSNAAAVHKIEYSNHLAHDYKARDLDILSTQVRAADAESFRLAYRIYISSEGALQEEVGVLLGQVSRSHPDFFLNQLRLISANCNKLKWALNSSGLEYVDRPKAQSYEIAQRKKALLSVKSTALKNLKYQCLAQFDSP